MKRLVYIPQKDITLYELALVLKVFTCFTLPADLAAANLIAVYNGLPPEAKRHFTIKED